jgi:transcriptional regulator with XRE-family HTH domain
MAEAALKDKASDVAPGLPDYLRELRKACGWSQADLADRLGYHLTHVNRIETGKQLPSLDFVVRAAREFGLSVDQLLAGREDGLEEVRLEDKELAERVKLIDTLDEREREALLTVIDSMLTKHRIRSLLEKEQTSAKV